MHGVIVSAEVPDSAVLRVKAALACYFDDAFASHASAARVWRVPVSTRPGEHVTVPLDGHRLRRSGVTSHHRVGAAVSVVHGVRVSVLADLFVELAEEGAWEGRSPRPPGGEVREASRRLSDRDEHGDEVRRYEVSWPEVRVVVEYDGRHHIERVEQWERDLARREAIDHDDWRIVVVVSAGIYKHPEQTVERVFRVLSARGLPGLPEAPSEAWRPHFPGFGAAA